MSRPLRIEFPGAVYHVTTRGNARNSIFNGESDKRHFLRFLDFIVEEFEWRCHAYCLMTNHFHLMIETPGPNLSEGMRRLNGRYTQHFNRRHDRTGHVLQGRFHSVIVEKYNYLLELSRYIVLNPVRAGLVRSLEEWAWSSYLATSGASPIPPFLDVEFLLAQFGEDLGRARQAYVEFVLDGLGKPPAWDLRGGILLGSDDFVARIQSLFELRSGDKEIPRCQRLAARVSLAELLANTDLHRDQQIWLAYSVHGYRQREIGEFLGLSQPKISQIVRAMSIGDAAAQTNEIRSDPDY